MAGDLRCRGVVSSIGLSLAAAVAIPALLASAGAAAAGTPPPIRIDPASQTSQVPACVTPERLMAFLVSRNPSLNPIYRDVAHLYKQHGDAWRVRWDYAFFQMVVETNALQFRRGDGRSGDVNPKQFNFAGLGTTGGGVPGDAYGDASAGILAQIQHLVVYSGERIERPIGARTRLSQDDILSASAGVLKRGRQMTFQDLSGRWAADRAYGRTIESVADRYRAMFCTGREPMVAVTEEPAPVLAHAPRPALRPQPAAPNAAPWTDLSATEERQSQVRVATVRPAPVAPPMALGAGAAGASRAASGLTPPRPTLMAAAGPGGACKVQSASFGGRKAVLIRTVAGGEQQLTALQVLEGFEGSMVESYTRAYAPGGVAIGEFGSTEDALEHAYRLCQSMPAR